MLKGGGARLRGRSPCGLGGVMCGVGGTLALWIGLGLASAEVRPSLHKPIFSRPL